MASSERLPQTRDGSSKSKSRKSRAHVEEARPTPTVDELRDARTSYYGRSKNEPLSPQHVRQDRRDSKVSGDSTRKHKSNTASQKPLRRSRTGGAALRGEYVYGTHDAPQGRKEEHARKPDRSHTTRVPREQRVDSLRDTSRKQAKVSVTQADIPAASARPKLHRSASTSQSKSTSSRPALSRRETVSAASPPKKENKRGSVLASLFRTASTPAEKPHVRTAECLTCGSDQVPVTRSHKLACGHRMCNSCLKRIFTMSIKDAAHMPPRCCTAEHIPLKYVDSLFDTKFKVLWNKKYEEYTTKNRLYCPAPGCGTWIRPNQVHSYQGSKYGLCPKCKTKVCTKCNAKWHKRSECPKDEDTQKLLDIAKEKGWQRCFNCKAMVELKEGCNHLTCRCMAEFCMLCAKQWKTCDCPWFNYAQTADGDRLNHMRVPGIIPIIRRQIFGDDVQEQGAPPAPAQEGRPAQGGRDPALTYQEELDRRRRQVERDERLARRLQIHALRNDAQQQQQQQQPPPPPPQPPRQSVNQEVFGNAGEHFMNDNFVQEATNVHVGATRDTDFLRRGERQSNRRRPPRNNDPLRDVGLAPNAFGTESMLGFGPPPPPPAAPRRTGSLRDAIKKTDSQGGGTKVGGWLSRLR